MSNTTDIKSFNISSVLRVLHQHKALTKTEIASLLGLSSVTAHNLINELKKNDIVIETGNYAYSGGRRAVYYKINENFGCAIGVRMSRGSLQTTVYNISLDNLYQNTVEWDMRDVAACIETIKAEINLAQESCGERNYLGLGITIPGHANPSGVVLSLPDRHEWNNVSIYEAIKSAVDMPIYIDNDNNAEAIASKWVGLANNYENYVYLSTDDGTGVGVVLDGQVFYGSNYYCCEIGHISVDPDGLLCSCGNRGCLQAYTGSDSIYARIKEAHPEASTPAAVMALYEEGDQTVREVINKAVSYTALAIEYIIRIFDPKCIILQSKLLGASPEFFSQIERRVFKFNLNNPNQNTVDLIFNDQSETVHDVAPACIVFNRFYSAPNRHNFDKV